MPRYIVKLDDYYFEWSTVVDAPVTCGVDRETFIEEYLDRYPNDPRYMLDERLRRVDKTGTSMFGITAEELISLNRAGPNETCLTKEQIIERYVEKG